MNQRVAPSRRSPNSPSGPWWLRLRRGLARQRVPALALQPLGVAKRDLALLRGLFDRLQPELGLRIDLTGGDRDVVLLDADYAGRTPASIVKSLTGDRPVVLFERPDGSQGVDLDGVRAELLRQLGHLPQLRDRVARLLAAPVQPAHRGGDEPASAAAFETDFDSDLPAGQVQAQSPGAEERALVSHVLRGLVDDSTEVLVASFGPQAALRMDFAARLVSLDPRALQGLRVRRELPRLGDAATLTDQAVVHDLDEVVWHLGIACGRYTLLGAPADDWHTALVAVDAAQIERFTRQPRHLQLMQRLQQGPVSPSDLRRQVRIQVADLRSFLQACLFLGLVRWTA